jgi:ketosteroid isomerase-like protein
LEGKTVRKIRHLFSSWMVIAGLTAGLCGGVAWAQLPEPGMTQEAPNPLTDATVKPGKMLLYDLEARFAKDVLQRGGAGFADWFADDGVALGNGASPLIGKVAIARGANWSPKDYELTWTPTDAMMGPSGDMGYTWGHYEGRSKDANGNPVLTSGRYITMWRRQPDGAWKVVLDAGANEPPEAGDCCKLH